MHPSDLYPGLAVRLSTTHPETEYKTVQWARVWYVSERREGAVMLVTWQTRRSAPLPLLVSASALIPEGRPAEPPEMPAWLLSAVVPPLPPSSWFADMSEWDEDDEAYHEAIAADFEWDDED